MPPIGPISRRQLIRYLHQLGFQGPNTRAKHSYMDNGVVMVTIPNPHEGDIDRDLLLRILRQAGIARAAWERL